MTTKTTYKVGDKVRILNAEKIRSPFMTLKDGDIFEITGNYGPSNMYQSKRVSDGKYLGINPGEHYYIEKVEESDAKMTQFKVGDKVRVIKDLGGIAGVKLGTIATVTEVDSDGDVKLDVINQFGNPAFFLAREVELISPKPTKNQRISTLEQKVEAMQAEIDALKAAKKATVVSPTMTVKSEDDIAKIAEGLAKMLAKEKKLTPNEQRKAIIDEAKAFVINYDKKGGMTKRGGFIATDGILCDAEFIVNASKRTVVCLLRWQLGGYVTEKAIAKCAPDDVFNADIGKAIALGRALGLDVSKFENAVQPSEYTVGQIITFSTKDRWHRVYNYRVDSTTKPIRNLTKLFENNGKANADLSDNDISKLPIIDDSEAQY